jgi:uncharacterized C2H2 Zn-finger protein
MEATRHRCSACGAEFDSREELDQHNREAHGAMDGVQAGPVTCPACGAEFATEEEMLAHTRMAHERVS